MHEVSIARALLGLVRQHAPPDATVRVVRLRVGPLQCFVPEALDHAWEAVAAGTTYETAFLDVEYAPWTLRCPSCGRKWYAHGPYETCACGDQNARLTGSDELTLVALDVDEPSHNPLAT